MAIELEAASADSLGAFLRRRPKHALPVGSPCPNCSTALQGPWCHACGQSAEDFHRSLWRLMVEALGGVFEFDSRLWRTLPNLILRPAKLTREYLDGHRAPQAPPFRTFLIVVVLVFLVGSLGPRTHDAVTFNSAAPPAGAPGKPAPPSPPAPPKAGATPHFSLGGLAERHPAAKWFEQRGQYAMEHKDEFKSVLVTWAQRLSILTLPLSALMLGVMFFWKRRVYMFDHLIFSMHSLSFQGLLFCAIVLGEKVSGLFTLLIFASPVHLFVHLKGTYGIGVFGTLIRMLLLFIGSLIAFTGLLAGLLVIGLYEMGP